MSEEKGDFKELLWALDSHLIELADKTSGLTEAALCEKMRTDMGEIVDAYVGEWQEDPDTQIQNTMELLVSSIEFLDALSPAIHHQPEHVREHYEACICLLSQIDKLAGRPNSQSGFYNLNLLDLPFCHPLLDELANRVYNAANFIVEACSQMPDRRRLKTKYDNAVNALVESLDIFSQSTDAYQALQNKYLLIPAIIEKLEVFRPEKMASEMDNLRLLRQNENIPKILQLFEKAVQQLSFVGPLLTTHAHPEKRQEIKQKFDYQNIIPLTIIREEMKAVAAGMSAAADDNNDSYIKEAWGKEATDIGNAAMGNTSAEDMLRSIKAADATVRDETKLDENTTASQAAIEPLLLRLRLIQEKLNKEASGNNKTPKS